MGKPNFTKMLSSPHLCRALSVRVSGRDHHLTLYRCCSPVTSTTRLCYITDCTCVLCPYSQVATVSIPFPPCFVTFVLYSFLSYLVTVTPLSCVFSQNPLILTTDSFACQELISTTFPGSEDSTFRISVTIRIHWSPTALAVPITLYDYRDMIYAPITSFILATEGTGCGTSRGSLHLKCYADASFASNDDLSSQLGYVILLCDAEDRCHILDYASRKCKRVVRSIMSRRVYTFAKGFDRAYAIKRTLEKVYPQNLRVTMLKDSKRMFDVITKASHSSGTRLMIDVAAAREAYNRNDISNVALVLSEHNIADVLTKKNEF